MDVAREWKEIRWVKWTFKGQTQMEMTRWESSGSTLLECRSVAFRWSPWRKYQFMKLDEVDGEVNFSESKPQFSQFTGTVERSEETLDSIRNIVCVELLLYFRKSLARRMNLGDKKLNENIAPSKHPNIHLGCHFYGLQQYFYWIFYSEFSCDFLWYLYVLYACSLSLACQMISQKNTICSDKSEQKNEEMCATREIGQEIK